MNHPMVIEEGISISELDSKIDSASTIQDLIGVVRVCLSRKGKPAQSQIREDLIDQITFDKRNNLWVKGIPIGAVKVKEVPGRLEADGADRIAVEFKTLDKYREQDLKTYSNRAEKIAKESGYRFTGFTLKVVGGYEFPDNYVGYLSKAGAGSGKLLDFGQKIGGAAKDRWKEINLTVDDLNDLNDQEALEFVKKDNIWKKINYKALIESGKDPATAYLIKGIRDAVPVKVEIPKNRESQAKEYFRKYIELVEKIRDNAMIAKEPEDLINIDERVFVDPDTGKKLKLSLEDSFLGAMDYKKRRKLYWALRITQYNIDQARKKIEETGWPEVKPWIKGYQIVEDSVGFGFDGVFVAKGRYMVRDGFQSKEDAEAWLKVQYEAKLQKRKKAGPKAVRPQLKNIERTGVDHRNGEDVTGDDMLKTFRFRGGEFGNWLSEQDRQQSLNHAYDALMDLSQSMGIPSEALSLGGRLSFAFGARGKSKAAAHYEPARRVINLTKMNGAGSLAHEFGHAFDHMLGDLAGTGSLKHPFASQNIDTGNIRPELADAFKELKESIFLRQVTTEEYIKIQIEKIQSPNLIMKSLFDDYSFVPNEVGSEKDFQENVVSHLLKIPEQAEPLDYKEWNLTHKTAWESLLYDFVDAETGRRANAEFQKPFAKALNAKLELMSKISATRIHNHPTKVPSQFVEDALRLDGGKRGKPYYSSPVELFARAFESSIQDKVTATGNKSDYLVHSTKTNESYAGYKPYPEGKEREAINLAFDTFLNHLKTGKDTTILESIVSEHGASGGTKQEIEEAVTIKKNHKNEHIGRNLNSKVKKGKNLQDSYRFQGLNISIQRKRGSTRSGTDGDGNSWSQKMKYDYGYIRSTKAEDGECVDCYVNKIGRKVGKVYVIRQKKLTEVRKWKNGICPQCGKIHYECNHAYDEDKAMLGFSSLDAAIKAYLHHFDTDLVLGPVSTYSVKNFKKQLEQSFGKRLPMKIEESVSGDDLFKRIDEAKTLNDLIDVVRSGLSNKKVLIRLEPSGKSKYNLYYPDRGKESVYKDRSIKDILTFLERRSQAGEVSSGYKKTIQSEKKRVDAVRNQAELSKTPEGELKEGMTLEVKSIGRKWIKAVYPGKSFEYQVRINEISKDFEVGRQYTFDAVVNIERDRYGTKATIVPIDPSEKGKFDRPDNESEIARWLGYIGDYVKKGDGYLYPKGMEKVNELGIDNYPEMKATLDKYVSKAEYDKTRQTAKKLHRKAKDYLGYIKQNLDKYWYRKGEDRLKGFIAELDELGEETSGYTERLNEYREHYNLSKNKAGSKTDVLKLGEFMISKGSGYGGRPFKVGSVLRNEDHKIAEGQPEYLYVISSKEEYVRYEGMSFGVGDEQGYIYSAKVRAATDEESMGLRMQIEKKENIRKHKQRLKEIGQQIQQTGERPEGTNKPEGKRYADTQNIYGGGEWFVIGEKYIWYVENHGMDGDSWDNNNVRTGGAGAIGWRIPFDKEIADMIIKSDQIVFGTKKIEESVCGMEVIDQATTIDNLCSAVSNFF